MQMRSTILFTALIFIVSTLQTSVLGSEHVGAPAPERKHHDRRPEDLIPSDHNIDLNRDFTNMIQFGLVEGMFKVKKSGLPDCTEEGMTIFRAAERMAHKMTTEEARDDDFLNLFQLYLAFATRCNYASTIQGVIVSRQIGEWLSDQGSIFDVVFAPLWLVGEVTVNLIDDIYILLTAYLSFKAHKDIFSLSIIVGKIFKIVFQWYLEGFILQGLDIEDAKPIAADH